MKLHLTRLEDDGEPVEPKEVARKFVTQCGVIVRERVPISIRKWKSTDPNEMHVLPDTEKNMLWSDIKEIFEFPDDREDKLREWTMKKMAILFQDYKKKLYKHYIKTGEVPDFENHPTITQAAWESFLQYKSSTEGSEKTARNMDNAGKKKYTHRMGSSGYKGNIEKWDKMEEELYARGIRPGTHDFPLRSKHWYYGHGGTLSPIDGSLIFGEDLRELALRLLDIIKKSERGEFVPDRDRDELTLALGNKEHPGRTRGVGIVPWKYGFKDDINTYRSRKRAKTQQDQRMRELEEMLAAQGSRIQEMEGEMQRRAKLALIQMTQAIGTENPNPLISPPQQRSSHASTEHVPPQELPAAQSEPVRYPVDEIAQRTACELHSTLKNISVVVRITIYI